MSQRGYIKIIDICLYPVVTVFLLAVIMGKEEFQQIKHGLHVRIVDLLIVAILLVLGRLYFLYRQKSFTRKFFQIAPFFLLFLYSAYRYSFVLEYQWGADDSFYYSYVASVVIDHDLDLTNQYEHAGMLQFMDEAFRERKTVTGLKENVFPVGCSILWTPFFLLGDAIAHALNAIGFPTALNGYSRPYTHTVVLGNLLVVCGGLYCCFLFAAQFFGKTISMISTLGLLFATPPLFLYFRLFQLLSEPLSMALIAVALLLVWKMQDRVEPRTWFLLGLLFGFLAIERYHSIIFALIPGWLLIRAIRNPKTRRPGIYCILAFSAACFLAFVPQLMTWRILYGSWLFDLPGTFLPWWKTPFVMETLFSSRKGLFPWTPVILFSLAGFFPFAKKQRTWMWLFLAILVVTVYINSAQKDWWGSVSFGARRFLPCLIIFVVGFSAFFDILQKRWRAVGGIIAVGILIFFGAMTHHLERSYAKGIIPTDHAPRFADAFDHGFYSIYKGVVYPLEFPVQLSYHLRYGILLYQMLNEFFIGDDVLYFQQRAGELMSAPGSPLFGSGWKFNDGNPSATSKKKAFLNLPMFFKQKKDLRMKMQIATVSGEKDGWIDFYLNGRFLRSKKIPVDDGVLSVRLNKGKYDSAVNQLELRLYRKRNVGEELNVTVRRIEFEPVSDDETADEASLLDIRAAKFLNSIAG